MSFASQIMSKRICCDQAVLRLLGELNAVVGQDRVDPVRHRFQKVFQEFPSRPPVSLSTNCVTANLLMRLMPMNR